MTSNECEVDNGQSKRMRGDDNGRNNDDDSDNNKHKNADDQNDVDTDRYMMTMAIAERKIKEAK
jgi:hypothetical protein